MVDERAVCVVGVVGERFDALPSDARVALAGADVVFGGRRHLALWRSWSRDLEAVRAMPTGRTGAAGAAWAAGAARAAGAGGTAKVHETVEIGGDAEAAAREVRRQAIDAGRRVCVLASGDPGFFGILRALLRTLDRDALQVIPAPSSVSIAFARLAIPWDDAVVVSAHGRPIDDALRAVRAARKAAVLTSPGSPPQALGAALVRSGAAMDLVAVCSRLGSADEQVVELSLPELACGTYDPLSVLVLVGAGGLPTPGSNGTGRALAWGLEDERFAHRGGMITKSEVRAVALAKLALPPKGVVWDVGAGSGSVAVECAGLQRGLTVLAIEERDDTAARIADNARSHGVSVQVVHGRAPELLGGLPDPDRAFVGGGGIAVLDAVLARLRPGGRVVATYAALDRASAAADRLGNLAQLSVGRGDRLPDGGWRLESHNPVFVCWGPEGG